MRIVSVESINVCYLPVIFQQIVDSILTDIFATAKLGNLKTNFVEEHDKYLTKIFNWIREIENCYVSIYLFLLGQIIQKWTSRLKRKAIWVSFLKFHKKHGILNLKTTEKNTAHLSSLQIVSLNIYTNLRQGDHFHNHNEGWDKKK